ncbi:MAG: DUF1476 domain-containing protein [Alphaproteobacteria bacterium]|nr:DUF1476 domain-containing protein [Alphaproteobacteria bacterium]
MSSFDKRQKDSENKFRHDQELQFKATNRRNKLLGQWAAELMGLSGDAASAYAMAVVQADFEEKGDADVIRKILKDVTAKGIAIDEHKVRKRMDELMDEAKRQIMGE